MKKTSLVMILCVFNLIAHAQKQTPADTTDAGSTADKIATANPMADPKNNTGDMNQKWAGFLSGFANLFGSAGNSLTVSPTLYTLLHLDSAKKVDSKTYRRQWFARNLQLDLSASPDNKNSFQVDSIGYGFTYTILNNLTATQKQYERLRDLLYYRNSITDYIIHHLPDDASHDQTLQSFFANGKLDETVLPATLVQDVKQQFHIKTNLHDALTPDVLKKALAYRLKIKPLWTVSFNENYGFQSRETSRITLSTEFSYFLHFFNKDRSDTTWVPIDVTLSYNWQIDTLEKTGALDRHVFGLNFGKDFSIGKLAWLEVKPSVSYLHIKGQLYNKESHDTFIANLTPRLRVNSQFWIPITVSWDPKNGQILGFLSIQYSLK
jgi:hypothetical protein